MSEEIITIIGIIQEKKVTESEAGADKEWKRIGFKINGESMSTFDKVYDSFKVGEVAEVCYVMSGEYKNIKSMKKSEPIPPTTAETPVPPAPPAPTPVPAPAVQTPLPASAPAKIPYVGGEAEKNASIVSQVVMKCVTDMICADKIEPGGLKTNMVTLANHYKDIKKILLE